MKYLSFFLLLLTTSINSQDINYAEVDKIFSVWEENREPGCALGIIQNGELVYKNGYGIADLEHDIPITSESVFYIGSVSKQFVTFCILLLEEEGKVNLDDKIQKYLPDFPDYGSPLTIRHFIHHTSGVRDYLTLMYLKGRDYLDNIDVEEVYELIKAQRELNFTPGERYLYSNSCYFMLAMIVEEASGMSIRKYADKNIFSPLGMKNTLFYDNNRDLIKNKVFSYAKDNVNGGFDNLIMRFDLVGSGGVYSSIEDLYKWDQNFYDNKLGKGGQAIIDKMHEEGLLNNGETSGYAFALNNGNYKGLRTVSHGGSLAGYRAELMRFPDEKTSIIILGNRSDAASTSKSYDVADIILKNKLEIEKSIEMISIIDVTKEEKEHFTLSQIEGTYMVQAGIEADILIKEEKLHVLQKWDNNSYFLERIDGQSFKANNGRNELVFNFDNIIKGKVQDLVVDDGGNKIPASRKETESENKVDINDYVGVYYSEELDINYSILNINGILVLQMAGNEKLPMVKESHDVFHYQSNAVSFKREDNKIKSFEFNAGRVQNLKFEKI